MVIRNGVIFTEDAGFRKGDLFVKDGKFNKIIFQDSEEQISSSDDECVIDAKGSYVIPGLVDVHFHGCVGYDFCDGTHEAFDAIAQYELRNGITTIVPATMTLSAEELEEIFTAVGTYPNQVGSTLLGVNMEGPFVSVGKKGAQNEAYIRKPDVALFRKLQELSKNSIRQVAVAPEEDADFAFIREVSADTVVSVAHTMANYDTARAAFENGANHVTHMFNAMQPFLHRDPGVVGAAYENPNVYVEMICDGIHIHPSMIRAMFGMFGPERICMISDSMMATGMEDGIYSLGGQKVQVQGNKATLEDGTIAGSNTNLMNCLRYAVKEAGIPLEQAVKACTITPARSLRLEDRCGSIAVGMPANFVILDENLEIEKIIKGGNEV